MHKRPGVQIVWLGFGFLLAVAFQVGLTSQAIAPLWLHSRGWRVDSAQWILTLVVQALTPLLCLLLGFGVAAKRPWDHRAWLLLGVLVSYSLFVFGTDVRDPVMSWPPVIRHVALLYHNFWVTSWPVWMIVFAIYFPERAGIDRRQPRIKWLFLTPVAVACSVYLLIRILKNENVPLPYLLRLVDPSIGFLMQDLFWFTVLTCLGVWAVKPSTSTNPDARRRLRVLFAGLAISILPVLVMGLIVRQVLHIRERDLPGWLLLLAALPLAFFPITLAYVTVVQRALDVRVLVRQGVQYALARRGVLGMQLLVSTCVVLLVAKVSEGMTFGQRILLTASGVGAVLLVGAGSQRLARWVDRHFFREAYDVEQVLNRLADNVSSIVELGPLLETVTSRLAEALHITKLAVFLGDRHFYRPVAALGLEVPNYSFGEQTVSVRQLLSAKRPLPVYFDNPASWIHEATGSESVVLHKIEAQLLLPIVRRDEMLGFLSLGPKISEAPYSPTDMQLLRSVASQTGLAIENSRLSSAIASETAQREVINRELAIAREVQQRLFPQEFPSIPGIELVGFCRPAREVGGDYYDFFRLPKDILGLAIGDISGKGIPASLLMASLQASLRGQTLAGPANIDEMMANISSLVYAASPVNRYATFFYAQYQADGRALTYVNAGHNPPILLRRGAEVLRLDAGGPPVGLLPGAVYQGASIQLDAGDLLLLFTDGMSEAMNVSDEEWGEDEMLNVLRECHTEAPDKIVEALFREADEFSGSAPQHDDMTVVIAKFLT